MLVVGLYDGNIAVYNLQKNVGVPNYQSDAKNGKHRDIVWQVKCPVSVLYCTVLYCVPGEVGA